MKIKQSAPRKPLQRPQKRKRNIVAKIFARIGITLLLLIPAYLAIIGYVMVKNRPVEVINTYYTSLELNGPAGSSFTTKPDSELFQSFQDMLSKGVYTTAIPDTHLSGAYAVTMNTNTGAEHYTFHFSVSDDAAYYVNESGTIYRTENGSAELFLNSTYAYELYPHSTPPVLTTAVTDKVVPSQLSWNYQTKNGNFAELTQISTTNEILTYPIANDVSFTFSLPPTSCSLIIKYGDTEQTYNSVNNISLPTLTQGTVLDITIEASFTEDSQTNYHGLAVYNFRMTVVEAASFSLDATAKKLGDYFLLTCHNVRNETELVISAEPALLNTPLVFKRGELVYAAIPADTVCSDPQSPRSLTVVYGSVRDTFALTILPTHGEGDLTHDLTLEAGSLRGRWQEAMNGLLATKIREKGADSESSTAENFLPNANFVFPADIATRRVAYGDCVTIKNSAAQQLTATFEYYETNGFITAMAGGYVVATGFDDLLGNYVILDHGGGIYTWYCGLGSIVADLQSSSSQYIHYVAAGDAIGIAGKTGLGFTDTNGAMIIASCGKTAISPEYLREQAQNS